jgi:hypothetical protein
LLRKKSVIEGRQASQVLAAAASRLGMDSSRHRMTTLSPLLPFSVWLGTKADGNNNNPAAFNLEID